MAAIAATVAAAGLLAGAWGGPARASQVTAGSRARAARSGSTGPSGPAGPAQINLLGHPGLCWQAHGNGSPVTLQACDPALQAQQWTLTSNGVLMNGTGYCLEGTGVPAGGGTALYVDFAGQCGGSAAGQIWRFSGASGRLSAPRAWSHGTSGVCAYPDGGRAAAGVQVVRHACGSAAGQPRWSWGYSDVTLTAGHGRGTAAGPFTASVAVSDAASAMTAYGVSLKIRPAPGLSVTGLRGYDGAASLTCDTRTLTCAGDLAPGSGGRIGITGRMAAGTAAAHDYAITAQVRVTGTSQSPAARHVTAVASVTVLPSPAAGGGFLPGSGAGHGQAGRGPRAAILLIAALAAVLFAGGALLIGLVRHRPRGRGTSRAGSAARDLSVARDSGIPRDGGAPREGSAPQGGGTGENGARERRGGSHRARHRKAPV